MSRRRPRRGETRLEQRARLLVRCYPRSWRERYGEEFVALLIDDYRERAFSPRRFADVLRHGLATRLRDAGLAGDGIERERQLRVSLGVVWCALAVFLAIGVAIWSQLMIDWQFADPQSRSTVAGMWLMSGSLLAFVPLLALAGAPVLVSLARALLAGRRRPLVLPLVVAVWGGLMLALGSEHFGPFWPGTGGHWPSARGLVPAPVAQVLWAGTSWFSTYWLHPGWLGHFPADQLAWMAFSPVALATTLAGTAVVVQRLGLPAAVLRFELALAGLGVLAMAAFLAGAANWVLVGGRDPINIFSVGAIDYGAVAVMTVALVAPCAAARRAVMGARAR